MEYALIAKLLATVGITGITGTRINWSRRPQGEALPAIVLHRIDGAPEYHLQAPSGLVESRVQVDCWGDDYVAAKDLARAVETAISGQAFVQGSIRFDVILIVDERDSTFDEAPETFFRTSLDLIVRHAVA